MAPITDWARSDDAPPGWRTKTIPLTPEALERVARMIDPNFYVNELTVLRSATSWHPLSDIMIEEGRSYTTLYIKSVNHTY